MTASRSWPALLNQLLLRQDLTAEQAAGLMEGWLEAQIDPVLTGGLLVALSAKGVNGEELAGMAQVLRQACAMPLSRPALHLVDTCGTGGDTSHTFNISTASAFVAAAAGARVAKHGGRSVSSTCGSADVLEALGVNLTLTPEQVGHSIDQIGIGFMFAPNFHGAMKHAAPVRRELGVRTMFNVLGPLTNPAGADNQVMGVFHPDLVGIQARVLQRLGSRHVLVVNGSDGLDEITISGATNVAELKDGQVVEYTVTPEQFGLKTAALDSIKVANKEEAKAMLLGVLDNQPGVARDIVQLNAGAAIYVAGLTDSLGNGIKKAGEILASGAAKAKLAQLVEVSNQSKA